MKAATKPTCKAQGTDKKLAGAVLNSFMKKCETAAVCGTAAVIDAVGGSEA